MQPELFGAATSVREQHFRERFQGMTGPSMNDQVGIVKELGPALLHLVHQRVFFVRVKGFVETSQGEHRVAARDQIAQDQFLFAGLAQGGSVWKV